jgi:NADPH-dependent 7-cyano-7-deazaguanine reductase QueF-like protein
MIGSSMNSPEQSQLGKPVDYPERYDASLLYPIARAAKRAELGIETAPPFFGADLWTAFELSWLTPRGKPQVAIAHFTIPCETPNIIESKSLKLYLGSFRNHSDFHEACTLAIGQKLAKVLSPRWLRIGGYWYPRGGMPIDVFWQTGAPPKGLWLPDQGVAAYRGR